MAIDFSNAIPMLLVYDVPTSIAFYRDLLGFEVLRTSTPFDDAKDNCEAYPRVNRYHLGESCCRVPCSSLTAS